MRTPLEKLYKEDVLEMKLSPEHTDIVEKLIGSNLLRYDIKGNIRWHSKLTEHFYGNYRNIAS